MAYLGQIQPEIVTSQGALVTAQKVVAKTREIAADPTIPMMIGIFALLLNIFKK